MRSASPPAGRPGPPKDDPPTLLDELLCIDGVTDLAVYRLLTGRFNYDGDSGDALRQDSAVKGQLALFMVAVDGGGE